MATKKWGVNYKEGDKKGYETLAQTFQKAYLRASTGKGLDRHSDGQSFDKQDIVQELRIFKSETPALFQARKKIKESIRLSKHEAVAELLDAMNYLAGAVIYLTEQEKEEGDFSA